MDKLWAAAPSSDDVYIGVLGSAEVKGGLDWAVKVRLLVCSTIGLAEYSFTMREARASERDPRVMLRCCKGLLAV